MARRNPETLKIREYRSQLAKLKRAGLVSPRIDARSHRPTRHMLRQIKKYRDVIAGNAIAVKTPSRKIAKTYDSLYDTKFDRVVVRTQPGETARYSVSREAIISKRINKLPGGGIVESVLQPREPGTLPKLPRNTKNWHYFYAIPFRRGNRIERIFIDSMRELIKFMSPYDTRRGGRFENWHGYVEIVRAETTHGKKTTRKRADERGGTSTKKSGSARRRKN